jgi:S-DNA-T family DNA segregation ATPase FtsK/SpoIIIE
MAKQSKNKSKSTSSSSTKSSSKAPNFVKKTVDFFKDERLHKSVGLLFILFSAYLAIAMISYIFTWKVDQSIIEQSNFSVWDSELEVKNWLGKLGAYTGHKFMKIWFGIASLLISLYSLILGVRILFNIKLISLVKASKILVISLVWISTFLALVFYSTKYDFLGGLFGKQIITWYKGVLGQIGAVFLVFFTGLIAVTVLFNPSYDFLKNAFAKLKQEKEDFIKEEELEAVNLIKEEEILKEEIVAPIDLTETLRPEVKNTAKPTPLDIEMEVDVPDEPEITAAEKNETLEPSISDDSEETNEGDDDFEVKIAENDETLSKKELSSLEKEFGAYDPKLDLSSYKLPSIDILADHGGGAISMNKEELEANKNKIIETLLNYKIEISKIKATIGPTVTLYEIVPAPGVRISKIKNLEDDIALNLAALGIRIIAPMPGKGTVGIEVPNSSPDIVSMKTLIASEKFQNSKMELPVALGKTISNETFVADLTKMPHLLMAGATGQGKSVGLNAILVSILYKKHPSQVKFVLVDPKKVELTLFNKIERHFLAKLPGDEEAIITDTMKVVATLNSLCIEMDNRYEMLKNAMVRNIKEYNAKFIARKLNPENGHEYLPYIVLVIDEFADLIMTAGKEVEIPIARLAQLARAIGIHLIVATQRPSVNVITGIIKANFPARIAFRVTSKIDSRTILDAGGADQLIGRGDMLYSPGNELIRLQCGFVDTPEVEEITDYIGSQRGYPDAHILPEPEIEGGDGSSKELDEKLDSLFEDAAGIIVNAQQGSASNIQRKLKIGYNRAGRIIDQMEATGLIGPHKGSKAREVYVPDVFALEQFLKNLRDKELL